MCDYDKWIKPFLGTSNGIADGGFDEPFPLTSFMMRPSILYVATVSDFLSSSRTPSYGLERGCRDPIFHSFLKANFQIRVFRTWSDRGGGFNQAVPFYSVFEATECPLRRDLLGFS